MKISEFIEYLEEQKNANGDIDVLCVTPGCSSSWETAPPNEDICEITDAEWYHHVSGKKFLYIGIGG